ncbi:hypothetical protein VB716_12780 [Synechococcus sp. CCY9201]|nr:hypothetical protein [Synechococcus sp. CCY9201]
MHIGRFEQNEPTLSAPTPNPVSEWSQRQSCFGDAWLLRLVAAFAILVNQHEDINSLLSQFDSGLAFHSGGKALEFCPTIYARQSPRSLLHIGRFEQNEPTLSAPTPNPVSELSQRQSCFGDAWLLRLVAAFAILVNQHEDINSLLSQFDSGLAFHSGGKALEFCPTIYARQAPSPTASWRRKPRICAAASPDATCGPTSPMGCGRTR